MATLSATVMAHPSRREMVDWLTARLDREVEVIWDDGKGLWATGRRALLAHVGTGSTHALVIQDDAVPCRDLLAGVEAACEFSADRPVSLYAGTYRPADHSARTGAAMSRAKEKMRRMVEYGESLARSGASPWLEYEGPWWGVAIVVPTADIPELVEWGDNWTHRRNYDARIGQFYARVRRLPCLYTMPSLVDHRPEGENPSLLGNGVHEVTESGRVAHWFIGEDGSALGFDWSLPPVGPTAVFQSLRSGVFKETLVGSRTYERMVADERWREVVP